MYFIHKDYGEWDHVSSGYSSPTLIFPTVRPSKRMATGVGPPAGNRCRQEDENDDGRGHPPNPPIRPARPSVKPHDGGYDCEFVKRPANDLGQADCPVCLLVLREPQQVSCCGYSFCRSCIQRVQADQNVCPACNEQFTTFLNKGLKRALYGQKVYCVHHKLGCEWEGELGELDRHRNLQPPPEKLLEGCLFSEVECTHCLQAFQHRYLQAHQTDDCPKRPFACQHCNQYEATFEEVTQSHWPVCPSFPLPCPNNCDLVLQRQELEQHVRYDCPLIRVQCDFHIAGCVEYLARKDMPSHISENIVGHMSHLQLYMSTYPGANIVECMGLMVGTIQKMAIGNTHTRSQLHEAREQLRESHDQLRESQDQLRQLQESHNQLDEICASHKKLQQSHNQLSMSHDNLNKMHDTLNKTYKTLSVSHDQLRVSHDQLHGSHDQLRESHDQLRVSHDQLHESLDLLRQSHDQCRDDLSSAQVRVAQLEATVVSQNEENQRRIEENHQLANKMEKFQEKMAQLERAMTTHTTCCEKQEKIIDAEHVAMTQSHEMVSQQVSGLQESLAQFKDELTTMMKASEEKLDKSLATTETKFQTSLVTSEAKLQRSLVISEEKLQASLVKQQTMITECSNDSRRLSQTINEQERKQDQKVAELQNMIDKKKTESMEKIIVMENQLQASLATQKATILVKYRSVEASEEKLRVSLAAQQTKCSDENRQLRQAITEHERKQCERESKMEKLVDEKKSELTKKMRAIENNLQTSLASQQTTILAKCSDENRQLRQVISEQERKQQENEATMMSLKDDFSHKIAASEQNIHDQEAKLTLHQQTLERVTCTGELPFDFTMTEFKKKKNDVDWYSPPFYTHTHGYRMCIKVYANGYGGGKGTHLSVFAFLMQGPYDGDLMWSFQGVITIQLLNQLEDGNHHMYTINFTGNTLLIAMNRVTSGERADIGYGTHIFLPHTQLDLNSKGNCQYLKDDQLKFRVSKATNLDLTSHIHRRCLKLESFPRAIGPQVAVAPIEFTLSDFEQQKNHNSVWISPAFYTHQRGYQICLQVHPNGNIDGQGTHVSIYTCLMKGPFDGGLKWPFRGDITIQIVDQAGEKNHEDAIHYNYNTPDSCVNRMTEGERSPSWGYHKFLPHTFLGYNTATNTQYLRANSLQIRITKVEIKNNDQKEATLEVTQSHVSVCPSISYPIPDQERKQHENEATEMVLKDNISQNRVAGTKTIFEKQERIYENIDFNYTGREHHLYLEKYGIKMHFPCHTSSPSVSSQLSIRGTVSVLSMDYDDYVLPEGSELVSAVYNISAEQPFPEPVTVKIQHCVPLRSDDDVSQLEMGFIIADEQHGPPYKFRDLDGGEFKRGSSYGKIQCSHFSNIAIRIKWKLGHPITLFAAAFYLKYNRVCFVVTKHLSTHISVSFPLR